MTTVSKELLHGAADDICARLEELAAAQDNPGYLAGTRLRELAVELAVHDELAVSLAIYDDSSYELEVTLRKAPHLGPVLIDRSDPGAHCQITLEQWLPIDTRPGIESAVNLIHAILNASMRSGRFAVNDATTGSMVAHDV